MHHLIRNVRAIHAGKLLEAMQHRHTMLATRQKAMNHTLIVELLNAAIHGLEPAQDNLRSFVVIQDQATLTRLAAATRSPQDGLLAGSAAPAANNNTLILICARSGDQSALSGCWQAARNLMIAARARGLHSSVFAESVSIMNRPDWKSELAIGAELDVVVLIMLSQPPAHGTETRDAEIISWK